MALFAALICGIGIGSNQWLGHSLLRAVSQVTTAPWLPGQPPVRGRSQLLQLAFTDPVNEQDLYYPAITSLEGILEANDRIFMRTNDFEGAYEHIHLLGAERVLRTEPAVPIVRVRFEYHGREYQAFAYGGFPTHDHGTRASLIIPGSGLNQSLGIATGDPANYHFGILDALTAGGDIYTLIKPNEDFLAWHNGSGNKLDGAFIWNWHLNRGGSYSVSYLVESLAMTKYLQDCFDEVILVGLSQGGAAVMLNALQSKPKAAIVASGHHLDNGTEWSGPNQLVGVPGYSALFGPLHLVDSLRSSPTEWLFTWGRNDTGTYRIEAEERLMAGALEGLSNVSHAIHDGGHVFPVECIREWLVTRIGSSQSSPSK